jgi:hypothetical protein
LEFAAKRVERRKADRAGLVGLENREIGERDADLFGELRQRDSPLEHDAIEIELDGHDALKPSDRVRT